MTNRARRRKQARRIAAGLLITRKSKIARLPYQIRLGVNRRLLDGQPGHKILRWLNRQPAVKARMRMYFGGARIKEQNLSVWRLGGYQDRLRQQTIFAANG